MCARIEARMPVYTSFGATPACSSPRQRKIVKGKGVSMSDSLTYPLTGRCACKTVSYELQSAPVIVHACHCSYCQRESGAAFAVNAVIEAERLPTQGAALQAINTPSLSGKGQMIWRCPTCQ